MRTMAPVLARAVTQALATVANSRRPIRPAAARRAASTARSTSAVRRMYDSPLLSASPVRATITRKAASAPVASMVSPTIVARAFHARRRMDLVLIELGSRSIAAMSGPSFRSLVEPGAPGGILIDSFLASFRLSSAKSASM